MTDDRTPRQRIEDGATRWWGLAACGCPCAYVVVEPPHSLASTLASLPENPWNGWGQPQTWVRLADDAPLPAIEHPIVLGANIPLGFGDAFTVEPDRISPDCERLTPVQGVIERWTEQATTHLAAAEAEAERYRPRTDPDAAYAAFMSMPASEWLGLQASLAGGGVLQPAEQKGYHRARIERSAPGYTPPPERTP